MKLIKRIQIKKYMQTCNRSGFSWPLKGDLNGENKSIIGWNQQI